MKIKMSTWGFWLRIDCLHGYFKIIEENVGDVAHFLSRYGLQMVSKGSYFTFSFLENAPTYSIEGSTYLGAPATKTFSGEPWQVMKENELIYDFQRGLVRPIAQISQAINISQAGRYFVSNGLILPGSLDQDGNKIHSYSGFFSFDRLRFRYSAVDYD